MFERFGNVTKYYIVEFMNRLMVIKLTNEEADFLIQKINERRGHVKES